MLPPEVHKRLAAIVGAEHVLWEKGDMVAYECDGLTIERCMPSAVVLPGSAEEVEQVVTVLQAENIAFLPRGAGTCLSGGTVPAPGSVVIPLTRLNRILEVDLRNRVAVVEAGCINQQLANFLAPHGYGFAPDPSSQGAATIGGNIAENAGGPHTLKYGVTINHVLGLEIVLPSGKRTWIGGLTDSTTGYDLTSLFCGSEGTMGLITKAALRITPIAPDLRTMLAVFDSIESASRCVSAILSAGIIPAALEMMDKTILQAVEAAFHFGFPLDAGAVLICELDGLTSGIDTLAERVIEIFHQHGADEIRSARTATERANLWKARKRSVGTIGRLAPSYVIQDGVVPRSRLPEIVRIIAAAGEKHNLPIANVMHAGDGSLHPIILFDERDPEQVRRVLAAGQEIMSACVDLGGSITGEHGVGIEKLHYMPLLYSPADLCVMAAVRDAFNAGSLCNPGKLLPSQPGYTQNTDTSQLEAV